jgi:hypothetical protein
MNNKINSVFLSTKRYLDKTYGNTYYNTRLFIDGVEQFRSGFTYGYGSADQNEALTFLQSAGIVSREARNLREAVEGAGAVLYLAPELWATKRDVKAWGN